MSDRADTLPPPHSGHLFGSLTFLGVTFLGISLFPGTALDHRDNVFLARYVVGRKRDNSFLEITRDFKNHIHTTG